MNEGLEKLKTIRHIHDMECGKDESMNNDFDIIEKDLNRLNDLEMECNRLSAENQYLEIEKQENEKALKIIVKKANIRLCEKNGRYYFKTTNNLYEISKEKYELLKKVLNYGK